MAAPGSPIGTNASTYALTPAEQDQQVRVQVSYIDGQGFAESVTSTPVTVTELPPASASSIRLNRSTASSSTTMSPWSSA